MAAKKKVVDHETNIISEVPTTDHETAPSETVGEVATEVKKPAKQLESGTIIKTYVQNGLRYNRITTENGGTVDVRA